MSGHTSSALSGRLAGRARSRGRVGHHAACKTGGRRRTGFGHLPGHASSDPVCHEQVDSRCNRPIFGILTQLLVRRYTGECKRARNMVVRPSAVAGQFYPGDADHLRKQVSDLLANIAMSNEIIPKALIAPHAGYVYSGATAAAAFATLRNGAQTITRVMLIGPAHYVHVRGIAAPTVDAFETPLGRIPVDASALDAIAGLPSVIQDDAAHAPEHALEVELPFLQTLLASFRVVPLLV